MCVRANLASELKLKVARPRHMKGQKSRCHCSAHCACTVAAKHSQSNEYIVIRPRKILRISLQAIKHDYLLRPGSAGFGRGARVILHRPLATFEEPFHVEGGCFPTKTTWHNSGLNMALKQRKVPTIVVVLHGCLIHRAQREQQLKKRFAASEVRCV